MQAPYLIFSELLSVWDSAVIAPIRAHWDKAPQCTHVFKLVLSSLYNLGEILLYLVFLTALNATSILSRLLALATFDQDYVRLHAVHVYAQTHVAHPLAGLRQGFLAFQYEKPLDP